MGTMSEHRTERTDSEILASRTVKAGKRVYYIDVKRDRRGERYIALTESKRVRDGDETMRPVFEKHKIFLYREDFEKFMTAFGEMLACARDGMDENVACMHEERQRSGGDASEAAGSNMEKDSLLDLPDPDLHIDIEF